MDNATWNNTYCFWVLRISIKVILDLLIDNLPVEGQPEPIQEEHYICSQYQYKEGNGDC